MDRTEHERSRVLCNVRNATSGLDAFHLGVCDAAVLNISLEVQAFQTIIYSGGRSCALIDVPWRLRCFSTFSTCANISFQYKSPRAEGAKTDPPPGHTYEGAQTTAWFIASETLNMIYYTILYYTIIYIFIYYIILYYIYTLMYYITLYHIHTLL